MNNLKEVMQALVSGKKLRKLYWDKDVFINFNDDGNLVVNYPNLTKVIKNDVFENYLSSVEEIEIYYPWFNLGDKYYLNINPNMIYTIVYVDDDCVCSKNNGNKPFSFTRTYYNENLKSRMTLV